MSQRLILPGERSGLRTRIAATEEKLTALVKLESVMRGCGELV
jgi:hypothetical protein